MLHWGQAYEEVDCMKKLSPCLLIFCIFVLLLSLSPAGSAEMAQGPYQVDLKAFLQDTGYREYVQRMLDYHLRTDREIRNALEGGFAAVFLFDGCSDNMNDPELSDLSYYRVSGICIALKLKADGTVKIVYYNEDASTIPDQPLKYGAWALPEVGDVGPATVCDGTYQLYSVLHKGEYEALHVRTDYRDATLEAIYMTPEGFTPYRASEINIHTRTSNHIANYGMWSAGCPLVGDGSTWDFHRLIYGTYYTTYDSFAVDNYVGTLTIDRQQLRQEMYTLYKNPDAVDAILANSRAVQPDTYLLLCSDEAVYEAPEIRITTTETQLMSLPCSFEEDARTQTLQTIPEGTKLTITGSIRNHVQSKWLKVSWDGEVGYVFSGHTKPESWKEQFRELLLGE